MKSLFTSIPLQLALDCTATAIENSTTKLPLPTDDLMDLLNLCLTSTYFQYNGKHYKQLHGTAMGSPVSVVVAEIAMQNIEEQALATYRRTLPLWLRYVDDTFTAVHKDEIDDFHEHLKRQNADIQFTKEIEENGKIPFLDCLVTRNNNENKLSITVYRKPTHTDRLLDQSSYNPTFQKATTIQTLTRRAQLICDSPDRVLATKTLFLGLYSRGQDSVHNLEVPDEKWPRVLTLKNENNCQWHNVQVLKRQQEKRIRLKGVRRGNICSYFSWLKVK